MQLVAYGAQDVYLTGNPQITFFKVVYRRHTNFAIECIEQTMTGNPDFGRRVSVTVIRNGDLATRMYLKVILQAVVDPTFNGLFGWVRKLGHALIHSVDVEIGGSCIDKHYGTWLDIWHELTHTDEQERGYRNMIGDIPELTRLDSRRFCDSIGIIKDEHELYIPLQFWFNRNTGLALPLIALQYHEVRLNFEFRDACRLGVWTPGIGCRPCAENDLQCQTFNSRVLCMKDATLLVDYIYLDSEERRRFAQVGHEYLIEQVQFTGEESIQTSTSHTTAGKFKLNFNHPTKELIWAVKGSAYTQGNRFLAYSHLDRGWAAALDDAALNIALGMLAVVDGATSFQERGLVAVVDGATGNHSGTWATSTRTCGPQSLQNVQLFNCLAADKVLVGVQNVLSLDTCNGLYNLGDKIHAVAVKFNHEGTFIESITVLNHSLCIRDISIPLCFWDDRRVSLLCGCHDHDVVVYQFNNYGLLIDGSFNPCDAAIIQLNGHDRFDRRRGNYFNYVQPYQHHTHTPADGINVYSFALLPEQHQPSGTANLSRIDNTQLNIWFRDRSVNFECAGCFAPSLNFWCNDSLLFVFAFSYNVLRIMSGMGGLAYSN